MVGLMWSPRGFTPRGTFQYPHPCGEPLLTHTTTGSPPTLAGNGGSVSCGDTAPLLWVLVHAKFCLCPPRLESLVPQPSGRPVIKPCWPSRPDSPGIPSPFVGSPGWEAWRGVQNVHNSARTSLILLFANLWVAHLAGIGFDFIVIAPLLLSRWGFFFVFGCGASFFWWIAASSCRWSFNS